MLIKAVSSNHKVVVCTLHNTLITTINYNYNILIFLFVLCGGLSWLPVSFLLHVKYTVSYSIVSQLPTSAGFV